VALIAFLLKAVGISLSGVMAPGAVTTAVIAQGARRRWAGVSMAVGHGVIEIPLIFLIMFGLGVLFQASWFRIAVGLLGGAFLVWMGVGMLRDKGGADSAPGRAVDAGPMMTGLILSVGNPYFLLWWATVGLNLALEARTLGWLAFVLFALVHWLCDLVWLTILSFGSFHGTNILGVRAQRIVLQVCGIALALFGIHFAYRAVELLRAT
jgi:threonine/homoserine/homoserine lactone efflux protein